METDENAAIEIKLTDDFAINEQAKDAEEADNCTIYRDAKFTAEKDEYLPIPASQIAASNGHYTQNIGNW